MADDIRPPPDTDALPPAAGDAASVYSYSDTFSDTEEAVADALGWIVWQLRVCWC